MAEKFKYDRGSLLSIFKSDRAEDLVALTIAIILAVVVVLTIPK